MSRGSHISQEMYMKTFRQRKNNSTASLALLDACVTFEHQYMCMNVLWSALVAFNRPADVCCVGLHVFYHCACFAIHVIKYWICCLCYTQSTLNPPLKELNGAKTIFKSFQSHLQGYSYTDWEWCYSTRKDMLEILSAIWQDDEKSFPVLHSTFQLLFFTH